MSPGRSAVVVLGALVLQVCLFSQFSYEGARPDVMVLVAVLGGFLLGPERGAILGFASGLAFDVVLTTPFGLSALTYTLVGYAVGSVSGGVVRTSRWLPSLVAIAGSALGMILYAGIGAVVGEPTFDGAPLGTIVAVVAATNAVLAPLFARAITWIRTDERDHRHAFFSR